MADRGIPLLSGPPPANITGQNEDACRKCCKEFNVIFTRSRMCNHCGYAYCHNCSDYQALMPRGPNAGPGYDMLNVCAYCIELLQITASTEGALKHMPLSKLKKYAAAYNISIDRMVEKEEIVRALTRARRSNGCLSPSYETYYRQHSVPVRNERSRGLFSREPPPPPPPPPRPAQPGWEFARPDLAPDATPTPPPRPSVPPRQTRPSQYAPPPPPQSSRPHPPPRSPPRPATAPPPPRATRPNPSPNLSPNPPPPRTRATSTHHAPAPPLSHLITLSAGEVASLSIGVLKSILADNHVHVGTVLEKGELVKKVQTLVDAEREERERQQAAEAAEEAERVERQKRMMQEREKELHAREQGGDSASSQSQWQSPSFAVERNGLCVVCQDEEANIAIVDCGHLAMCRGCSELVMSSTRECPLCRTRIISDARLLRIFKT